MRAMRKRRPNAMKMRRRLIALAGAKDKRIWGRIAIIATSVRLTKPLEN